MNHLFKAIVCVMALNGAVAAQAQTTKVVIADFETVLSGFSGKIARDATQGKDSKASAKIEADLSKVTQNAWVTASRSLDLKNEIKSLSFWVKSSDAQGLAVRIVDSTKQTFQQRPQFAPNGEWQQVVIPSFENGPGFETWGGAGDKKVHWPATELAFILEKGPLKDGKGAVLIDNIEAQINTEKLVGKLDIGQDKPGNVFFTNEPVRIPVETQGDKVLWAVSDFQGNKAGLGSVPVANKQATVTIEIKQPGYFEMHLVAQKDGAVLAQGDTTFVVTTPLDLKTVQDSPFGVMTHFAQNWDIDIMPVIARSGAKNIRDELYWDQVEAKKGEYAYREQFEKYMAAAKANGIDPLIVLSFANKNYDGGNTPHTAEGYAAYARYAQEVLRKYGPQIKAVEIWNEYNGSFANGPATENRPKFYTEMLKAAYAAIKKERPDVKVVGISAVSVPFPYFTQVFENGALPAMDAISFHPYRTSGTPEGLERQINRLQDLTKKYNNGQPKPLWITEIGWYVTKGEGVGDVQVTEADQAKYLARTYALALSAGVEKTYWYLFRDYDQFATMGMVRGPNDPKGRYAPKPAYAAFATLTRQLNGTKFQKRETTLNDVYSLLFKRDGLEVRVMWSLAPVTLPVKTNGPLAVVKMTGQAETLRPVNGEVQLSLTDAPIYVWGNLDGLPPAEKQAGVIVANAEEEFSNLQGADGWYYGSFTAPAPGGPYNSAEFKPFPTYRITPWNYEWGNDQKYLVVTPANQHPGVADGKPVWSVRRWVSKVTGNVRLQGQFNRADKGDGTTARIFVDGKAVWTQQVGGGQSSQAKYDLVVPVKTGSPIDFAVDPGPGISMDYDATSVAITITQLP